MGPTDAPPGDRAGRVLEGPLANSPDMGKDILVQESEASSRLRPLLVNDSLLIMQPCDLPP